MKRFFALTLALIALAGPAFAISLDDARAKGLVGERLDGYVGAVSGADADVQALINEVNAGRKAEYTKIAAKNGQNLSVVEKLSAGKLIERAKPGEYFMNAGGSWQKK